MTQIQPKIRLSGREYFSSGFGDTGGVDFLLGVSRPNTPELYNRQLWIGPSELTGSQNGITGLLCIVFNDRNAPLIRSISSDGATVGSLQFGSSIVPGNHNVQRVGSDSVRFLDGYFTNLYGTIAVASAAQTNITSLGTLTGLTMGGNILASGSREIGSSGTPFANLFATTVNTANITSLSGTISLSGATTISGNLLASGSRDIGSSGTPFTNGYFTNITGTLATAAQTNVTSLGTLTNLSVSGRIGIAASSPSYDLQVGSTANSSARIVRIETSGATTNHLPAISLFCGGVADQVIAVNQSTGDLLFAVNPANYTNASLNTAAALKITPGQSLTLNKKLFLINQETELAAPASGGANPLPANPAGYLLVNIGGVDRRIAYY